MIVRDGEGASRVMQIEIRGARSEREAKIAAHAVATSSLVKRRCTAAIRIGDAFSPPSAGVACASRPAAFLSQPGRSIS